MFEELSPPYVTIVAGPPWDYEGGCVALGPGHGDLRANQPLPYSGMTINEIANMPVSRLVGRHARLFLWTTNRYLPDAFGIVRSWGFTYKQTLVWHKIDTNLQGSVAPNSTEFLLVCVKGSLGRTGVAKSSVVATPHSPSHSQKPPAMLDLIEQVSPGPYVELFARQPRMGWDAWGLGYEGQVANAV